MTTKIKQFLFGEIKNEKLISLGLLTSRVIAGFGLMLHGLAKIEAPFNWMGDSLPSTIQFLVFICEFVGGIALMLGLVTRLVSFCLSITMIGAIIIGHLNTSDPLYRITVKGSTEGFGTSFLEFPLWFAKADGHSVFGSGSAELAILYLVIGISFFCSGAGVFAVDGLIRRCYFKHN